MPAGPARSPSGCRYSEDDDGGEEESGRGRLGQRHGAPLRRAGSRGRSRPGSTSPFIGREPKGGRSGPRTYLILVRRRGELASLIVARLHAEGVPVAGVDRLLLSAPLAVQDLLAAARFAVQPLDDLNLASLLVSPLFGWSQDELFAAAFGRDGAALAASCASCDPGERRLPRPSTACSRSSPWPITRRRTSSSRRSCPGRSTAAASCWSGSAPRRAIRSRNCSPRRSSSRATPARLAAGASSTGSRAARSRSSAIPPRRSTRSG